jgi:hypothetical protein
LAWFCPLPVQRLDSFSSTVPRTTRQWLLWTPPRWRSGSSPELPSPICRRSCPRCRGRATAACRRRGGAQGSRRGAAQGGASFAGSELATGAVGGKCRRATRRDVGMRVPSPVGRPPAGPDLQSSTSSRPPPLRPSCYRGSKARSTGAVFSAAWRFELEDEKKMSAAVGSHIEPHLPLLFLFMCSVSLLYLFMSTQK